MQVGYMFRPLQCHHQAFLLNHVVKRLHALLESQLMFTSEPTQDRDVSNHPDTYREKGIVPSQFKLEDINAAGKKTSLCK